MFNMFFGQKESIREVSCLFATRDDEVLLETKDGIHWHFPQEEIRGSVEGNPTETPIDAIHRIVRNLDDIEEEDVVPEGSRQFDSPRGLTEYHIFITQSKLHNGELREGGPTRKWEKDPHSKKLNPCTEFKLKQYGFYPKEKEKA